MVKITGHTAHSNRLRRMTGPEATRAMGAALYAAGDVIKVTAQLSITTGAVSGAGHVPSKPGEPPKADTHALDRQIENTLVAPLKVEVASNDPKSAWLEWGTSKMEERPFMRPAAKKGKPEALRNVRVAINRVNGGRVR